MQYTDNATVNVLRGVLIQILTANAANVNSYRRWRWRCSHGHYRCNAHARHCIDTERVWEGWQGPQHNPRSPQPFTAVYPLHKRR